MKEFYQKSIEEILNEFDTKKEGLTEEQARNRLEKYGKNELKAADTIPLYKLFLENFKDPMVVILLVAAVVQVIMGDLMESLIIFVVLVMNSILGVVQAKKAEDSINSLKEMSVPMAKVIRNGEKKTISSKEVVPGDCILLEAGDYVPADGRLIETESLKIVEGMLTGESEPVEKTFTDILKDVSLGDRKNFAFSTSMVVNGRATMIATNTGMSTEIGKIADLLENTKNRQTPLQRQIEDFSKKLGIGIIVLSLVIFAIEAYRAISDAGVGVDVKGAILNSFMFAVAIAVAAIPEALSSIVTIVMSVGTKNMAKKNAIIRKLPAVETLGSTSVICTDKTGTLTQNKMTAVEYFVNRKKSQKVEKQKEKEIVDGEKINSELMLNLASALCNDSTVSEDGKEVGDPTEVALTVFADKMGYGSENIRKKYKRLQEIPFDSERKLMSTVHKLNGKTVMITKGAPDVILNKSKFVMNDLEIMNMNDDELSNVRVQNEDYSKGALRVLAFAYKEIDEKYKITIDDENDFTFIGLIAMIDPPRESVKEAVKKAKAAGIKTVMITGDHKTTAVAIAKNLEIFNEGDLAYTGQELDNISEEELHKNIEKLSVYARVSPQNKIRIVNAWQDRGLVTAMTGDGVNDAPALKNADIGVGMGSGTEVAKDASDMVLVDDNFTSIVEAVEVGRTVYSNIKKSITYLFSGNLGAIISILFAVFAGWSNPFTALQLIFINMVNDSIPAIALGLEKPERGIMSVKPRNKNETLLGGGTATAILLRGIYVGIAAIIAQYIGMQISVEMGMAMAFTTLILTRTLQTVACRSDISSAIKLGFFSNKYVIGAIGVCLMLLGVVLLPPIRDIFSVPSMYGVQDFLLALVLSIVAVIFMEISKKIRFLVKK